jgi:hypothetical protein
MARPTPLAADHLKMERSARFDGAAAEKCGIVGASLYFGVCVLRTAQPVFSPHSVCVLHVFSLRLPLRCEKVSKVAPPVESMLTFGRIVLPTAWTLQRPWAIKNDPVGGSLPSEVLPHRRGRRTPSISGERLSVSQCDGDPLPQISRRTRALCLCCVIGTKWSSDLLAILRIFSNFRSASVPM